MGWWQARLAGLFGDSWWIFTICFRGERKTNNNDRGSSEEDVECQRVATRYHDSGNDVTDTDSGLATSVQGLDTGSMNGSTSPNSSEENKNLFTVTNGDMVISNGGLPIANIDAKYNEKTINSETQYSTLINGVHQLMSHVYHSNNDVVERETDDCCCYDGNQNAVAKEMSQHFNSNVFMTQEATVENDSDTGRPIISAYRSNNADDSEFELSWQPVINTDHCFSLETQQEHANKQTHCNTVLDNSGYMLCDTVIVTSTPSVTNCHSVIETVDILSGEDDMTTASDNSVEQLSPGNNDINHISANDNKTMFHSSLIRLLNNSSCAPSVTDDKQVVQNVNAVTDSSHVNQITGESCIQPVDSSSRDEMVVYDRNHNTQDQEDAMLRACDVISNRVMTSWRQNVATDDDRKLFEDFDVSPKSPTNVNFLDSLSDVSFDDWFDDFETPPTDVIKSPPPYRSPVSPQQSLDTMLSSLAETRPLFDVPYTVVPATFDDVTPLIDIALGVCWQCRRYGESMDCLLPPQTYFTPDELLDNLDSTSIRNFKRLVFDLVVEVFQDIYRDDRHTAECEPWSGPSLVRPRRFPGGSEQTPTTVDDAKPIIYEHVLRCLGLSNDERTFLKSHRKWLIGRKTNSVVDYMLVDDLCLEEPEWVYYDHDINTRKLQITDFLLDTLMNDTAQTFKNIQRRRKMAFVTS